MDVRPEIALWESRFEGEGYLFGTEPNAFLVREAPRIAAGGRVLAVADGEGRNGVWLAQQGFAVHSIEGSSNAVAKAISLADSRGVPVVASPEELQPGALCAEVADILAWDWPQGGYDAVAGIFIQFLTPEQRTEVFASMAAALSTGGVLLLEGYAPKQLEYATGGPGVLEQLYDEPLLAGAFPTLTTAVLTSYDAPIEEGPGHSGMSALIDLIAVAP